MRYTTRCVRLASTRSRCPPRRTASGRRSAKPRRRPRTKGEEDVRVPIRETEDARESGRHAQEEEGRQADGGRDDADPDAEAPPRQALARRRPRRDEGPG